MKHLASLLLLSLLLPSAHGQAAGGGAGARNPMADPFAANSPKVELAPRVVPRPASPPLAPVTAVRINLPPGLRAILIRENGMGLLATGEAGALSIPVSNGKEVRILDQEFRAEISPGSIRLLSPGTGRVVWEGTLAGNAATVLPADITQFKYIPPLSAGVNPGLGASASNQGSEPLVNKTSEVH